MVKPFLFKNFYAFYRPETNYNFYRKLLTLSNKFFNSMILGIRMKDVNWVKVYRKDQLDYVNPELKSSLIESEICAKLIKAGCVPIELPSIYRQRNTGLPLGGSWKTLRKAIEEMYDLYETVSNFNREIKV